jgi:8-oxo-dGTP pyrophosphatase MutT (NUDIX family)
MGQNYKIFINEKTIFIHSRQSTVDSPLSTVQSQKSEVRSKTSELKPLIYKYTDNTDLHKTIENFATDPKLFTLYIFSNEEKKVLKKIINSYTLIKAAGGIVKNLKNEILFIFRKNRWDLPKGKAEWRMENGEWRMEKKKLTAIREVEEECGLKGVEILRKLSPTYHMYTIKGVWVMKKTYWYEMLYSDDKTPIPEEKEGITKIQWFKENEISEVYQNTFQSIHELVSNYHKH